jgi:RNA polymerase sigma-70 factor (ECF subfamily)
MSRLGQGDIGALGELYDRHQASIRRFLARATVGADDVDDLVHTTFLTAATSAARYDGRADCRPWLMGIAVRLLRRRQYALGRWRGVVLSLATLRRPSVDPRSALSARADVERALGRLSQAKRITLLLAEVEGLSCPEIAAALDIPVGTVWTRLHTARRELRQWLGGGNEP